MSDRTNSTASRAAQAKEQVAIALSTERLPWHPAIGERFGIERSAWRALVEAVFPSAKTSEGVILALSYCKARNLDPFKRPVHVVPIWNREKKAFVETVWPGIGELRTTAIRTKLYAGCDETKFGPDIEKTWRVETEDQQGTARQREITVTYPEWAQVTVYRLIGDVRYAIPGPRVYWLETYATASRNSPIPNEMWLKRPRGQLDKCAEAAALRRGFPEELGDEASADEMGGYSGPTIDGDRPIDVTPDRDPPPPPPPEATTHATARDAATRSTASTQASNARQANEQQQTKPADTQQHTQAPSTRSASPSGQAVGQPKPGEGNPPPSSGEAADEGGFEAWIVGADGVETTVDPYADAVKFARDLMALCATNPKMARDIWDANEPAIMDAGDASPEALQLIGELRAELDAPPVVDEVKQPETKRQQREPVAMPLTPKKQPHWPNYGEACAAEIAELQSEAEITEWIDVNKANYSGQPVQIKVDNRIKKRREALGLATGEAAQQVDTRSEAEMLRDRLVEQIRSCTTQEQWVALGQNEMTKADVTRLKELSDDLFADMRAAHAEKDKELKPAGGTT